MSFVTDVYPSISKSCESCHTGNYSTASTAYSEFQAMGYDTLVSQPTITLAADSVKYWKQVDSLLRISNFYTFANGSHKTKLLDRNVTTAELDKIYGWIIEGGQNN